MKSTTQPCGLRRAAMFVLLMIPSLWVEAAEEPALVVAYPVEDLPVWRLDGEGKPQFDALVVIAYLKEHCDPGTRILGANDALIVFATRRNHDRICKALAPIAAFANPSAAGRLEQRMADARTAKQRILFFVSKPNSEAVKEFFDAQYSEAAKGAFRPYLIQCVRSTDKELLVEQGLVAPRGDEALLAILDPDEGILAQAALDRSVLDGGAVAEWLAEFLGKHHVQLPSAKTTLAAAQDEANRAGKRVLVHVSGPGCMPCIRLTRYLESQRPLLDKDYVLLALDTRMPGASEVLARLRKTANGPVPWMAILSKDGNVLIASEGEKGNIGYPRSTYGKAHFRRMLETTSRHLTEAEIDTLIDELGEAVDLPHD